MNVWRALLCLGMFVVAPTAYAAPGKPCVDYRLEASNSRQRAGNQARHDSWLRTELSFRMLEAVPVLSSDDDCGSDVYRIKISIASSGGSAQTFGAAVEREFRVFTDTNGEKAVVSGSGLNVRDALNALADAGLKAFEDDEAAVAVHLNLDVRVQWYDKAGTPLGEIVDTSNVQINKDAPILTLALVSQPGRFLGQLMQCQDLLELGASDLDLVTGDGQCAEDPFKWVAVSSVNTAPLGLRLRIAPWIRVPSVGVSTIVSAAVIGTSGLFGETKNAVGDAKVLKGPLVSPLDVFGGFDFQIQAPYNVGIIIGGGAGLMQVGDTYRVRPTFGLALTAVLAERGLPTFGLKGGSIDHDSPSERADRVTRLVAAKAKAERAIQAIDTACNTLVTSAAAAAAGGGAVQVTVADKKADFTAAYSAWSDSSATWLALRPQVLADIDVLKLNSSYATFEASMRPNATADVAVAPTDWGTKLDALAAVDSCSGTTKLNGNSLKALIQ